jgi:hypothetical protein
MALDTKNTATGTPTEKEIGNTERLGSEGSWCEIRVRGHLGNEWSDWFGGLELERPGNGEMILSGRIADEGALIGILSKLNRLNLALTSIRWSEKRGDTIV